MQLSVVIVSFNVATPLKKCLLSLQDYPHVIVVDNHSEDDTALMVREHFPYVRFVRMAENVGFSKAVNLGAQMIGGDAYLFLNPDAYLLEHTLEDIKNHLEYHYEASALGFRQVNSLGQFQLSFGPYPTFLSEFSRRNIQYHLNDGNLDASNRLDHIFSKPTSVAWVSGSSLCVRKDAFWEAGGFDEGYFLFFEDIDLCLRLSRLFGSIIYDPTITICHERGASGRRLPALELNRHYRNSQKRFWRCYHGVQATWLLSSYLSLRRYFCL